MKDIDVHQFGGVEGRCVLTTEGKMKMGNDSVACGFRHVGRRNQGRRDF